MSDWRKDLLKAIKAPTTPQNLRLLQTWQRWEGGHTNNKARYNWLNTTNDAPGAVGSINSVGVKAFDSYKNGVNALAITLLNGRYNDIVQAFRTGNPYKSNISQGLQVWVSGKPDGNPGYAQKVLGRPVTPKAPLPQGGGGATSNRALVAGPRVPKSDRDYLRQIESMAFGDDPELLQLIRSIPDPVAQKKKIVSPKGSLKAPANVNTNAILQAADSQIGKPYVFGSGPDTSSFDCSDLIQWAYKQAGIDIPRDTYSQMKVLPKKSWNALQPGDLIYKNNGGHVVMYVGEGKVIAAPYTGTVVQYQPLSRFSKGGYHVRYVPRKK